MSTVLCRFPPFSSVHLQVGLLVELTDDSPVVNDEDLRLLERPPTLNGEFYEINFRK